MMRKFVIAGCGNSGTLFTARLLTSLGVRTAHEEFFTAYTAPSALPSFGWWLNATESVGEVSSLATPYLSLLPRDTLVFHQVRNPVAVIRSLMGRRTFHPDLRMLPNLRFFFRHMARAAHDDAPLVLAMKYWLFWNRLVSECGATATYRVEDMPTGALQNMLFTLGVVWEPGSLSAVLDKYGTTFHAGARDESITWASLPDGVLKREIASAAAGYGYSPDELEAVGG